MANKVDGIAGTKYDIFIRNLRSQSPKYAGLVILESNATHLISNVKHYFLIA